MKKKVLLGLSLLSVCTAAATQSAGVTSFDSTPDSVLITTNVKKNGIALKKRVVFMHVNATPMQQKTFMAYPLSTRPTIKLASVLPSAAKSSMSNVPVLDQGEHGTCATFANTAAIDALLDMGDGISQLCNLSLGASFDSTTGGFGFSPSGWDGTYGVFVLDQMTRFGVVTKANQSTYSCGGLTEYPGDDPQTLSQPMSPQEFSALNSINVMSTLDWSVLLSASQRFVADVANPYNGVNLLSRIKQVFAAVKPAKGKRMLVTIGFQLYTDMCDNIGACAKHNKASPAGDTWSLTKAISHRTDFPADGHEVILVGYDDKATAVDDDGVVHTGLLTIRNSWGNTAGDAGNFYMTYDYFMKFVTEAHEIRTVPQD